MQSAPLIFRSVLISLLALKALLQATTLSSLSVAESIINAQVFSTMVSMCMLVSPVIAPSIFSVAGSSAGTKGLARSLSNSRQKALESLQARLVAVSGCLVVEFQATTKAPCSSQLATGMHLSSATCLSTVELHLLPSRRPPCIWPSTMMAP